MDPVLLSRIQFGFTAGFHFLFPPLTFGLTLVIVIFETMFLAKKKEIYKTISSFLVKILALVFVTGVATGITLEFSFGTNWSEYSRFVGDIFGAPLAAEGIFSFFLESVFLAVLLFGRKRVSPKLYWLSAFLVFFGSHLSGLWIIIANSWMQTPAGYKIVEVAGTKKAVLTDFFAAALNPSTIIRYIHTVVAGWLTGSILTAAIGAWYLLKFRHQEIAKKLLNVSLAIFIIFSFVQLGLGHAHSVQVAETQPEKMAAFEGLWETQKGAPLALFGIPDESEETTHLFIGIPKLLSFLIHFDADAEVKGLKDFKKENRPPVFLPFASYHTMIALGSFFILFSMVAMWLYYVKHIYKARWFLWLTIFIIPLPHLANETGWIAAEVGRHPWAVFRVLRTSDAASVVVPGEQILFSLLMFGAIYLTLFLVFVYLLVKFIKKGPDSSQGY